MTSVQSFRKNVTSVFGGFELSLKSGADPLAVACFTRWGKPVPCLPMMWTYGSSVANPIAVPIMAIELPPCSMMALEKQLPQDVWQAVHSWNSSNKDAFECWVLVHSSPHRAPCQKASHDLTGEVALDEINLSHHAWLCPEIDARLQDNPEFNFTTRVQTGIFNASGVEATHQDLNCLESRGLAFGCLEPREVVVHDHGCFSPCNCMMRLVPEHVWHSCLSISLGDQIQPPLTATPVKQKRLAAAILHIIPAHEEAEHRLSSVVGVAEDLADACAAVAAVDDTSGKALFQMLQTCCDGDLLEEIEHRRVKLDSVLKGLPPLSPWAAPTLQPDDYGVQGTTTAQNLNLTALAMQLVDAGFTNFELNMEALQAAGGNVEAAAALLMPM